LGIAVVGTGFLGAQRAAAARRARGTRLIAVHDRDAQVARRVAERHGAAADPSLDAVLERPEVAAVIIATPHADHAPQVKACLEAGKHVLCEKPLAIDADEARELTALASECGLRLATGFNHRFYPPVRDALRLVQQGAIGKVTTVRASIGHQAAPEFLRSWHTDIARSGGGTLMDNGPHACDLIRQFLGEIESVEAYVLNQLDLPEGCESDATAWFTGRDGGVAELQASWQQAVGYLTIEIQGQEGNLRVDTAPWRLIGTLANDQPVNERYWVERIYDRIYRAGHRCETSLVHELESFASFAASEPKSHGTGWDGCRATEMVLGAYRSAALGNAIPLQPLPTRPPHVRKAKRRAFG
jgi:predicted dehydrogenase